MQLTKEIKNDLRAAKTLRLPWWGLLCVFIGSFPTIWLFDRLGSLSLSLPTLNGIVVLGFAVAIKWNLRGHVWFWVTMLVVAAFHVAALLLVPWTTRWVPAAVWAGAASVDFLLILVVVDVVERLQV